MSISEKMSYVCWRHNALILFRDQFVVSFADKYNSNKGLPW